MRIVTSDQIGEGGYIPHSWDESHYIYNALDNCITYEVHQALSQESSPFAYDMSRQMQGPALTMMRRGVKVDQARRGELVTQFTEEHDRLEHLFMRLTRDGLGEALNPRSPAKLQKLFYDYLGLDPIMKYDKNTKERRPTTDRDALEKLERHDNARPFVTLLLALRDYAKQLQVLKSGIGIDGRIRCSYHVAGPMTGRWSSSESAFYEGTNLQNISDPMRSLLVADPGKKLCQIDLAQAESVVVGFISQDPRYLEALASGDLHTYVAKLCWAQLPWVNDKKGDREVAERPFYRHYSYRDMSKRGGHGSNYGGTPPVIAMHLKIEQQIAREFQDAYFTAFPGIRRWHRTVEQRLAATRKITTEWGRVCFFPGRPTDSSVIKSAIAYEPQSTIGDYLNEGLFRVWRDFDLTGKLELLLQVHDAIVFQYDPADESWLIPAVQQTMLIPLPIRGRECIIKSDAAIGWNWGKQKVKKDGAITNLHGLREWKGGRDDRAAPEEISLLDRWVCHVHQSFK